MTHGFITIATGDEQYYRMAVNLLSSYRYFTGSALPFAVLADRENEYTAGRDAALDLAVSAQAVRYRMQSTTLPSGILDGQGLQMFLAAPEARAVQRKVKPRRQQYHNTHSQIVHAQRSGKVPGGQSRAQYARVEQLVY